MKRILTILYAFLFLSSGMSARNDAHDALMKFAGNIHQFNSIFPQEKVFLQFDNTSYYTGETIWFKAFVVSASTLERAQSKVLYVDLISPDGVLLKQQKLKIVAGQADGSLPLLDGSTQQARNLRGVIGYPSGFYEVRAYTNFMQNFSEEAIFSRVFAVYEKPKEEGGYYDESPNIIYKKNTGIQQKRPETPKQKNINVTFHPEGGHLILNQPCQVAFKVTGENGLGIDAEGILNDGEMTFGTVHNGMGSFTFTPTKRHNSVEFTVGGSSRLFDLPGAETDGCAIQLQSVTPDSIDITLRPTLSFKGRTLGLTLTCRGELMDFSAIDIEHAEISHHIGLGSMPEGVFRLTLFDERGFVLATRSFYHSKADVSAPTIGISTDKDAYGPFEKVTISFQLTDGNGVPFRDRFCLGVKDTRGYDNIFRDDLRTSLLLSSDLKGLIENPSFYFNNSNPDRIRALDLLCLVQGWERYDWQLMAGVSEFQEKHRLEQGLTLNGWVLDPSGKEPLGGVEVNAALMPRDRTQTETYAYSTDESGYFGFDIGVDFYDRARFTISATTQKDRLLGSPARLLFERSITPAIRAYMPGETVFNGNSVIRTRTKNIRPDTAAENEYPVVISVDDGFLLPDVEIDEHRKYIDYYTFQAYNVMEDVELDLDKAEYTTDVLGYLIDKGYQVLSTMDQYGNDSIESINGFEPFFYVHNNTKYRNTGIYSEPTKIDTRDIKSIMVYDRAMYKKEAWMLAPLFMDYIASTVSSLVGSPDEYDRVIMVDIQLKEDEALSTRKDLYKINRRITTVDGYSSPYMFYSPEYPTGPIMGDVDYRRTLYWNPNVVTDSDGKASVEFYNSSITSHFNVQAAGITASGLPYTADEDF